VLTHNGKQNMNRLHVFNGKSDALLQGAEEGATKIAEAVETAGARVAKSAGQVAKDGVAQMPKGMKGFKGAKLSMKDAQLSMTDAKLNLKDARLHAKAMRLGMMERLMRSTMKRQAKMLPSSTDAMVKAQLVKTSRELASESSDLSAAVDSLNKIIRANRRGAAKSRTRLLGGAAIGAALMYHLDSEHGRERRAATGQVVTRMIRGQGRPPTGAP
jgi:hypothetical protein